MTPGTWLREAKLITLNSDQETQHDQHGDDELKDAALLDEEQKTGEDGLSQHLNAIPVLVVKSRPIVLDEEGVAIARSSDLNVVGCRANA